MTPSDSSAPRAQVTRQLAAEADAAGERSPGAGPPDEDAVGRHRSTATRYWLANTWVEVLPDGACFVSPYEGRTVDTGRLAATTEAALATVAFRIDQGVPLVHTSAWADPDRWIPALDERSPIRYTAHRVPPNRRRGNTDPSESASRDGIDPDDTQQLHK